MPRLLNVIWATLTRNMNAEQIERVTKAVYEEEAPPRLDREESGQAAMMSLIKAN